MRRRILELLARRPQPAGQAAEVFSDISRPAVSRHPRLLLEAGLVEADRVGRQRIYRADVARHGAIEAWIAELRPPWKRHLDALETEVHRTRRERQNASTATNRPDEPPALPKEQHA